MHLFALTVFYFGCSLPLSRTTMAKRLLPNTPSHQLAAAMISILHTLFISGLGFSTLAYAYANPKYPDQIAHHQYIVVLGGRVSLTYFMFDTLYLIWREGFSVVKNKYFAHHLVAIWFTRAACRGLFANCATPMLLWYTFIEASNVFLGVWELTKRNMPLVHNIITVPFVITYVSCRGFAVTYGTYKIWNMIGTPPYSRDTMETLIYLGLVNSLSMWFGYRISASLIARVANRKKRLV